MKKTIKEKIKFHINNYDDRRELVAILADNGYKVSILKEEHYLGNEYFVIVEL